MDQSKLIYCGKIKSNGKPCYSSYRPENVRRHIKNVHKNILEECVCGLKMKPSSIQRHKKYTCPKTVKKPAEMETNAVGEEIETTTDESSEIESITSFPIQTEVKLVKYKDGRIILLHDEIKIGSISLKLTSENGKFD